MSSSVSFGSGGATQPLNPAITYDPLGYGVNGSLTSLPGAGANVKGAYTTIGTSGSAWSGFDLDIGSPNSASNRYLLDIRIGGATVILPNVYVQGGGNRLYIPIQVGSGVLVEGRVQCQTTSASLKVGISGRVATTSLPPGFTTAVDLGADTANTLAGTINVAAASTQVWTELIAATSEAYGALLVVGGHNGTLPATAQTATMAVATGAAAAETQIGKLGTATSTSQPALSRAGRLLEVTIPSGTRLSGAFQAATPGTDAFRFGLHGFK